MRRVKYLLALLPVIICFLSFPRASLAAWSDTKTLTVTKDTFANEVYPDKNYASSPIIISNKFTTRLGYLQFEDLDLPEGAILDRGTLKFYVYELHYSDRAKLNVGPITGDWEENTLTWNDKPTINQTQAIEAEISLTEAGWREISITHLVRQWYEGTAENKGVFIYPLGYLYGTAETEYAFTFRSGEATENQPKLEVEYHFEATPTPSPSPPPEPTITLEPEASPSPGEEEVVAPEEEAPTATPEEEKEGTVSGLSTGQMIIGGVILLSLAGAGGALLFYALRRPKKPAKAKPTKPEEKPEKEAPEEL